MLIEKACIEAARARLRGHLAPTPLIGSDYFSARLGANVFFKLETLQPTHSFKVRGAFNALSQLKPEQKNRGVVTASGGNHGLAVAYAAKTLGIRASVYLPESATEAKLAPLRRLGPEIVIHGAAWDEADALAREAAAASRRSYIHPFDNFEVMAGQATIALEIADQLPSADLIVASIGGGGLICGIASGAAQSLPRARIAGVETEGADSMSRSVAAGRIVELPAITSIAETLGARRTGKVQFEIVSRHVSELAVVPDSAAIAALLEILAEEKLLVEPAASCSVAALATGRIRVRSGENVVVVLCGANVSPDQILEWSAKFSPRRANTLETERTRKRRRQKRMQRLHRQS
jgi:threonine dehydratase